MGTQQASGADVEPGGGQGSANPASFVPGPAAEQLPTSRPRSPQPPISGSYSCRQRRGPGVHVQLFNTSFQSLTSHGLGTGTTVTVVGLTWRERAARRLTASPHSPLSPSSHLCLTLSYGLQEVRTHVLGQFYLAEPLGS